MPCNVLFVVSFPEGCLDNVAGVEVAEEVPELLPPLHDISASTSTQTTRIEIETDLERCNATPFLFNQGAEQGNHSKENNKDDCKVENQFLYTTACLKYSSRAAATKDTAQTCTSCLKQNKHDDRYTENNLYYPDCRKPQL